MLASVAASSRSSSAACCSVWTTRSRPRRPRGRHRRRRLRRRRNQCRRRRRAAQTAKVEVANVEGMSLAAARKPLKRQGLKMRVTRSASERPRGDVLRQAPPAGSRVDKGTVVALVASLGMVSGEQPAESAVEVPGVSASWRPGRRGVARCGAASASPAGGVPAKAGNRRRQTTLARLAGRQRQRGRTRGREASAVTVERIEVLDVFGSAAASARSELRAAGLKVTTTGVVSQESAGTVVSQSPGAGADVQRAVGCSSPCPRGPPRSMFPTSAGWTRRRRESSSSAQDSSCGSPTSRRRILRRTASSSARRRRADPALRTATR